MLAHDLQHMVREVVTKLQRQDSAVTQQFRRLPDQLRILSTPVGPPKSAACGSCSRTSRGRVSRLIQRYIGRIAHDHIENSGPFGRAGLHCIQQIHCTNLTRSATPCRSAFLCATCNANPEISVASTLRVRQFVRQRNRKAPRSRPYIRHL